MTLSFASVNLSAFEFQKRGQKTISTLIQTAHRRILNVYRLRPLFFAGAFSAYFLIKMTFEWMLENHADPMQGPWMIQVAGGLCDLVFGGVMLFAYAFSLFQLEYRAISLNSFLSERLKLFIAESLTAFAHIVIALLFFIIPGLVFYILYSLIPYVVFFDQEYLNDGERAYKKSKNIVKKHFFIFFLTSATLGVLTLGFELMPKVLGFTNWWQEVWFSIGAFYVGGLSFMIFYGLFLKYTDLKIKETP